MKDVGKAVVNVANFAKDAVQTVSEVVTAAVNVFVGAVDFAADVLEDGVYEGSIDKTANLQLGPAESDLVDSPWGKAYPLYHQVGEGGTSGKLDIYCKDCGITGQVHMAGELKFSICKTSGSVLLLLLMRL